MANSYPLPLEDVPASQIYLAKDVRKCGFLKKKAGGFKIPIFQDKYDNRYFIIHKGWAYYYKNEKSERPQGKISLQGYSSMVVNAEEEEATMPFVFKVFNKKSTERTWYFATDNQLEKDQWMEAFKLEIERYNVPKDSGYFRGSTSCPVAPTHDRAHPQQNHKSASVNSPIFHNSPVSHNPPVSSNFGSSGIGSSVSSVFPEENYEPVDQGGGEIAVFHDDDSEFESDTTDEDYEPPISNGSETCPTFEFVRNPTIPPRDPPPAIDRIPEVPVRSPVIHGVQPNVASFPAPPVLSFNNMQMHAGGLKSKPSMPPAYRPIPELPPPVSYHNRSHVPQSPRSLAPPKYGTPPIGCATPGSGHLSGLGQNRNHWESHSMPHPLRPAVHALPGGNSSVSRHEPIEEDVIANSKTKDPGFMRPSVPPLKRHSMAELTAAITHKLQFDPLHNSRGPRHPSSRHSYDLSNLSENEVFQPSSIPVQPTVPDWPHDLPRRSPPHPPSSNNIKSNVSPPVPVKPGWIRPSPSNQVQPSVSDISNRPPLPPPKRSSPGSPQSNMKFGQPNSKLAKPGTVDPSSPQSVTTFSPQHNVTPFRSPFAERNPMPTLQLNPKSLTRHDERYYEENYTDTSLQPQYDENIGDGELMESTSYCSVEQPDSEVSYDMPEMDTMDLPKNGGMDKMNSYPSNPSETMPVKYYNTRNLDSGNVHDVMSKDMPIVTAGSKTTKELNSAGLGKLVPNSDSSSTTPEWLLKLKSKPKNVIVGSNDGNASLSKTTFSPTAKSQPKPYPSTPKVASPPFTGVSSHKTEDIKPPWVKTTNPSKPPIPQKPGHKIGAKGAQRPPPPPNKPVVGSVSALKSRFDQQ